MSVLDNYKEPEKYKNAEDMTMEERVGLLERDVARLMVQCREQLNLINLLLEKTGLCDSDAQLAENIKEQNRQHVKNIEDIEVAKLREDIKDL